MQTDELKLKYLRESVASVQLAICSQ